VHIDTLRAAPPRSRRTKQRGPLRRLLLAAGWHRRLLAALLAALSMTFALSAVARPAPATVPMLVAAEDLAPGTVRTDQLEVRQVIEDARPPGALTSAGEVAGRSLLVGRREGSPIVADDLMSAGLLAGYGADTRAVPVRVADAGSLRMLRIGDHVDVLAAATVSGQASAVGSATTVASDVPVLALPVADDVGQGGLLVVAGRAEIARRVAGAAVTGQLSVVLRPAGQAHER
jgi:Flp pilus assembly protein CpaB